MILKHHCLFVVGREYLRQRCVLGGIANAQRASRRQWKEPMLQENNTRTGCFDDHEIAAVIARLPEPLRPAIQFAYVTGWRIPSEVIPLEWRQVNFDERLNPRQTIAGTVRLDSGTTKNREGRVFPMTADLRALLLKQRDERDRLKKAGHIMPWVFFREIAESRGGAKHLQPIKTLIKAFKRACRDAGYPGCAFHPS
jgi:integrase